MAVTITRVAPLAAPTGLTAATGTASGDLTSGVTYYYRICATTSTGWGMNGFPTAEVSAVADANGSIDLSWTAPSGAAAYVIYRTGVSGDYSILHIHDADLNPDVDMMCLRNGKSLYANPYTTTATSFTDTGTATTNTSTRPNNFSCRDNQPLLENGRGLLKISGGTVGSEGTFDDIYADAVANGYASNFNKVYGMDTGYRVFECIDDLQIMGEFKDYNFSLIYWNKIQANLDTATKQFGRFLADNTTFKTCQFIMHSEVGRQVLSGTTWMNVNLYGVKFIRDFGNSENADRGGTTPSNYFSYGGSEVFYNSCTLKNVTVENNTQKVAVYGTVDFDTVDILRNNRGISFSADQTLSSYTNVRLDNAGYDTTGNKSVELIGSTFYNNVLAHRFFNTSNITRTLLDCKFPNGHGLPSSASNGWNAKRNVMAIKWTFDIKVLDEDGNEANSADVTITDNQGNVLNLVTNATGDITTQEVHEATYNRATETLGNFDTKVDYNPYTVEVNYNGKSYTLQNANVLTTTSWILQLQKGGSINKSFSKRIKL